MCVYTIKTKIKKNIFTVTSIAQSIQIILFYFAHFTLNSVIYTLHIQMIHHFISSLYFNNFFVMNTVPVLILLMQEYIDLDVFFSLA